jgi:hypothetical protein
LKLVYFVHDLADPAVIKRVRMLHAGGGVVTVLGFHRGETAPIDLDGAPAISLGRTFDGRMGHRAAKTLYASLTARRFRKLLAEADVVMARSLEMLAVASAARALASGEPALVYECLDVHRLMLGGGLKSRVLRAIERALAQRADLLAVSSPAFLWAYFASVQGLTVRSLLIENKVLELDGAPEILGPPLARRPWRIGWMGALRCARSLEILCELAARRPDLVCVRIHGRPAPDEVGDLPAIAAAAPSVAYFGPYRADDLSRIYGGVHFAWAIDFMEEDQNSAWLLPNRIYESAAHGVPPIALAHVETGRTLLARDYGAAIATVDALETFFEQLTPERYDQMVRACASLPRAAVAFDRSACRDLVRTLSTLRQPHQAASVATARDDAPAAPVGTDAPL